MEIVPGSVVSIMGMPPVQSATQALGSESPTHALMPCSCQVEILNYFETWGPAFSFHAGSLKYPALLARDRLVPSP